MIQVWLISIRSLLGVALPGEAASGGHRILLLPPTLSFFLAGNPGAAVAV